MSNLLEKASILTTPTAYDDGKILSVKPAPSLGSELVVNGDFATDSNWFKDANWTIANGKATSTGVGRMFQSIPFLETNIGTTVQVTFDITELTANGVVVNCYGGVSQLFTTVGTHTFTTTTINNTNLYFNNGGAGNLIGSIDNVSVKQVIDGDFDFTRNSSATRVNAQGLVEDVQILSSNLVQNGDFSEEGAEEVSNGDFSQEGSELVTNGDFATDSDWNKDDSWSINNDTANYNYISGRNMNSSTASLVVGKTYKLVYTLLDYVSGSVENSSAETQIQRNSNGTYTEYFIARFTFLRFRGSSGGEFSIDNVSVKEVGQNWNISSGASVGENKLNIDAGAFDFFATQNALTNGLSYKVTLDAEVTSGDILLYTGTQFATISSTGTYTFYTTSDSSQIRFRSSGSALVGSITNISVKEVGQDWTLGTGINIGENKAIFTSTASGQSVSQNAVASSLTNGALAKVSFEVLTRTEGSFGVYFSGTLVGTLSSAGVFTAYFTKGTETSFYIRALGTTSGSISNISVIEITDDTNLPRINYEGFSYQDALGSELIANGDFSNGSTGWTVSNGTITDKYNASMTSYQTGIRILPFSNTGTFKVTFDLVVTSGSCKFDAGGSNNAIYSTSGTKEIIVTNTTKFEFNAFNLGWVGTLDNVSVKEYLGQEVVPDSGVGSWLFEPQSTNLITQSENLSNMQIAFGGAIALDSNFINPSGQKGSYFIYDTDGGTQSRFRVSNSGFTLGDKLSYSVFLKSNSSSLITIGGNYGGENCTFNVGSKTLISQGAAVDSYEIINFTNGWTRYIVNTTFTNTVPGNAYPFFTTNATLSEKIYLWGHQLEVQSFGTSYIPTNGSTVTRLQDAAFGAGSSDLINSTEGVLYAEIAALADGGVRKISISDGSLTNYVSFEYSVITNLIRVRLVSGGVEQSFYQSTSYGYLQYHKIAISYKINDFKIYIDGLIAHTDTSSIMPIGLNVLNFSSGNGAEPFFGKTKCVAVFKEALTDAELTCLTTI